MGMGFHSGVWTYAFSINPGNLHLVNHVSMSSFMMSLIQAALSFIRNGTFLKKIGIVHQTVFTEMQYFLTIWLVLMIPRLQH